MRIAQAGYRLAALINDIYGEPTTQRRAIRR